MSASVGARVTRQSGTNFYYAFRILPEEKRRAIYALYAFCRVVDDCVDEEGGEGEAGLAALAGRGAPRVRRDSRRRSSAASWRRRWPASRSRGACFEDVVAGCRMDLATRRYATFADLRVYCERVASAVGLASIEIFGYDDPRTREYAVELGLALQLTNILRDVGADAARDRLYLPLEDLARFGVSEDAPPRGRSGPAVALRPPGLGPAPRLRGGPRPRRTTRPRPRRCRQRDRRSMLAAEIMGAIYRAVLEEWARRGHPVGGAAGPARQAAQDLAGAADDPAGRTGAYEGRRRRGRLRRASPRPSRCRSGGTTWCSSSAAASSGGGPPRRATRSPARTWTTAPTSCSGPTPRRWTSCGGRGPPTSSSSRTTSGWSGVDEKGTTALDCPPLGAPLHLLVGLLGLRVPLAVKLQAVRMGLAVRFGRRPAGLTLAEYFRRCGQGEAARRLLWDPLALAVLNEPVERAAAVLFHRVYQEAFLRDHRASRLVFLRRGWGVLVERLARYFEGRGGVVRRGARVEAILVEDGRATGVRYERRAETREEVAAGRPPEARVERGRRRRLGGAGARAPRPAARGMARAGALRRARALLLLADRLRRDVARPRRGGPAHARPARQRDGVGLRQGAASRAGGGAAAPRLRRERGLPQRPEAERRARRRRRGALRRYFPAMAGRDRASARSSCASPSRRSRRALSSRRCARSRTRRSRASSSPATGPNTGLPATIEGAVRSGQRAAQHARAYLMTRAGDRSLVPAAHGRSLPAEAVARLESVGPRHSRRATVRTGQGGRSNSVLKRVAWHVWSAFGGVRRCPQEP